MPKKNFIYKRCNFLSARQNLVETIDAYVTCMWLLTKSCHYGSFEEEMIRDHLVMSCFFLFAAVPTAIKGSLSLSLELLQTIAQTIRLSDHLASKNGKLSATWCRAYYRHWGHGCNFLGHIFWKKGILFVCTHKTKVIFNHF